MSPLEAQRHLGGLGFGGEVNMHWHKDILKRLSLDHEGSFLDSWHVSLGSLYILLHHQRPSLCAKTSLKGVTPL
jgi:hypothetical protein